MKLTADLVKGSQFAVNTLKTGLRYIRTLISA